MNYEKNKKDKICELFFFSFIALLQNIQTRYSEISIMHDKVIAPVRSTLKQDAFACYLVND